MVKYIVIDDETTKILGNLWEFQFTFHCKVIFQGYLFISHAIWLQWKHEEEFQGKETVEYFFNWIKEEQLNAWHKAYTLKVCKTVIGSQRFWWWILPQIKKQSKQHQRGCHTSCVTTASRTIIVAAPSLS